MEIKPIETVYNGYRFRSRAEARWAVFFDAASIEYQYEPEGVKLSDGTLYLPDFYLPESKTWFEVKGVLNGIDAHKVRLLKDDTKSPVVIGYPDMTFEACSCYDDVWEFDNKADSVICRCNKCNHYYFLGLLGYWGCLCCGAYDGDGHFSVSLPGDGLQCYSHYSRNGEWELEKAFLKARQARFEHEETPT